MTPRTVMAIGAVVLALVAGGASVDRLPGHDEDRAAAAEPTSTPTPVPSWRPVSAAALRTVDAVELGAESIVLRSDDRTVSVVSMRDAKHTVGVLNRLLGTPARTQTAVGDAGRCVPASTTSTWGGALRVAALREPAAAGNRVEIRVLRDHVRSRLGSPVELSGPDGVQVGDDVRSRIEHAPADERESLGSEDAEAWQLLLAPGWPSDHDDDGDNGVSVLTQESTVTVIGSPMPVHATRTC
ncbi:hypothetical protein [Curtobacterium sp. MCSS17_015]|uniref:hypothetical protein n=1 Tax=Curtobacterium sp. MCSS17_015 TaxID=2175666 RepID=UPI0011B83DD6|nr:hypothetical protein [Curtobacterium sp. MCSS17_015]WIB26708.1 hypothetical protein DEJ18_01045 [Curtobacterium sp. MCSS17_015]